MSKPVGVIESKSSPWTRSRLGRISLVILCVSILFLMQPVYSHSADSIGLNSDSVNALLQGNAIAHGNVLLQGWTFSNISFYTTDLLYYGLLTSIAGFHFSLLRLGTSIVYTVIVAFSALLAMAGRSRIWVRAGIVLLLIGFPVQDLAVTAFSPMDHTNTVVFVLATLVILAFQERFRWVAYTLVLSILTFASIGDSLVWFIAVIPITTASLLKKKWVIAGLAILSAVFGHIVATHIHGFRLYPTYLRFTKLSDLPHHFSYAIHGILSMSGANFFGTDVNLKSALSVLHIVGAAGIVYVAYMSIRKWRALDYLSLILIVGMVINMAAFLFSTFPNGDGSDRYLLAFIVFGAILVARQFEWLTIVQRIPRVFRYIATGALVIVYAVSFFAFPTANPNQPAQNVVSFLEQHHLTNGYGSYWSANILTALSNGSIRVSPTYVDASNRISEYYWESSDQWYGDYANFMVFDSRTGFNQQNVIATFGRPAESYRIGQDVVFVWDGNITQRLQHVRLTGGVAWG